MFWKILPVFALSLGCLLGAPNVGARNRDASSDCCDPKPCCEPKPKCCVPVPCCEWKFNPCPPKGCAQEWGFFATADFLYWRSENHGYSYAFDLKNATTNTGSVIRDNAKWDPGFRVGAGWNTDYDFWDVYFNWTWYYNHSHTNRNRGDITATTSTLGYFPQWPVGTTTTAGTTPAEGPFKSVSGKWNMHHNSGDLEVGRLMFVTKTIAMRPHWGARAAWIDQKFGHSFTNRLDVALPVAQSFSAKNNWWGVGPRTGAHAEWHLSQGFSILGKLAGALLYGQTRVSDTVTTQATTGAPFLTVFKASEHFDQLVPNLQMMLGFMWQTCFNCDSMFFSVNACWETNYWWNQFNLPVPFNGLVAPMPTVGNQPLTMEGLTVNFEFDF